MQTLTESKLQTANAMEFILAGNATFTLRSLKTGVRYTYKVRQSNTDDSGRPPVWFVSMLTGQDNEDDFTYLGTISNRKFRLTAKSKMSETSTPVVAFAWFLGKLAQNIDPQNLEIWHSGRCGRCGRTLTVPESVEQGFGPECINKRAA